MGPHLVEAKGAKIPALGFGTWQLREDTCVEMVLEALNVGYRHIDTARIYNNEESVGEALNKTDIPREEIFLTTKIWPEDFSQATFPKAVEASLKRLQTESVDLLLLHWPNPEVPLAETVAALCEAKRQGMAKSIGVSNFPTQLLKEAIALAEEPLAVNQVEYHPFLDQTPVKKVVDDNDMILTAYSPVAQGKVLDDPTLQEIAEKYVKSPIQVSLRWLIQQKNVCAIPRTSKPQHVKSNFDIFDFELSSEDVSRINQLRSQNLRLIDPAGLAPEWD